MEQHVRLNVKLVESHFDGTMTVAVPISAITEEQDQILNELFPHCPLEIQKMLTKEALIRCVLPPMFKQGPVKEEIKGKSSHKMKHPLE